MMECYSVKDLENWEGEKPVLAVIGDPVGHSKSPQLHTPALRARGVVGAYIRVRVAVGEVGRAFAAMEALGMVGCNVTIPHKQEAMEHVSEVTEEARLIGAVNTVYFREGGRFGSNSDAPGFARALEAKTGRALGSFRVMVLGAGGGAGRAAAVQCAVAGCRELWLLNRTRAKVDELARRLPGDVGAVYCPEWTKSAVAEALRTCDLVVNGTSLGMKAEDEAPVDVGLLGEEHVVFEMIYKEGGTKLSRAAFVSVDGLEMLLHQGVISFRTWFGDPVPEDLMRRGIF